MFYTDKSVVYPYGACWRNNKPQLTGDNFPSDVNVPLLPNPQLEEDAKISQYLAPSRETVSLESRGLNTTTWTMDLLMKGARPTEPDAYLCAAYPVTVDEAFIYKFEALADASTAHHIIVNGCDGEAYSDEPFWTCPAICKGYKSTILFAWAKNAPPTVFPRDVGLRIGQRSPIKTIVLQVHYGKSFPGDSLVSSIFFTNIVAFYGNKLRQSLHSG
ncbi:unnamed protein product [Candidula unifasciata]|uniref:peptidylglycine monooxygenase n=1 Tax=Candidula unifasciata TaxID=100452 RepID=A0A8S3ZS55_9EUPU|nr:unnamed protein product [Candidula unifasciata]